MTEPENHPPKVPGHRAAIEPRSGDTHVITSRGKLRNTDQALRDAAAAAPQGERDSDQAPAADRKEA